MAEKKNVNLLMRGMKEQLRNPAKTVAEFTAEASAIEKTLETQAQQYDRRLSAFL